MRSRFCPLWSEDVTRRRVASGKARFTPLGRESYCRQCGSWWPADSEFFYLSSAAATGLLLPCKACIQAQKARKRARRKAVVLRHDAIDRFLRQARP